MNKAILVVSFGTSYLDALKNSIEKIEGHIGDTFKGYKIQRAFTSNIIIKAIKKKHNMDILTPEEALMKLKSEGVEEIIVQPLHIIPGEEFQYIKNVVNKYFDSFKSIRLGRPIFYFQGIEDLPQDYTLFLQSVNHLFEDAEATVLFGHGSANPSNSCYGCLQAVLEDEGYDNVFVGTVEGYPNFNTVLKRLKRKNIKMVKLVPLMVVAGDHAKNDMASDEEDSWKSMLEAEGIKVKVHLSGLGEEPSFNKLYINRINDIIEHKYVGVGDTKKR